MREIFKPYRLFLVGLVIVFSGLQLPDKALGQDLGKEGFANSGDIKIHYVTKGKGPLLLLMHGFPDYWYSWRDQIPPLSKHFQVVAMDLRGFNKSGQPKGVENYKIDKLVGDVEAVRKHFKREKLIVVGHDWGGMIAWSYAMQFPERVDRLILLNLPHPKGLMRELANNPQQRTNSQYARDFQKPGFEKLVPAVSLIFWVKEKEAKKKYLEAFRRSSIEGMLNYYKANYPRPPYKEPKEFPKVKCPVLMIHGLKDKYLLPGALSGTWNWLENELTLITIPNAGHFVHRDVPEVVTRRMLLWLTQGTKTKGG